MTYDPTQRMSYSALTLHRKCPQAWTYRYVRGLEAVEAEVIPERTFGSWWHALRAADSIERGTRLGTLLRFPPKVEAVEGWAFVLIEKQRGIYRALGFEGPLTRQAVLDLAQRWWEHLGTEAREVWRSTMGEVPARLEALDVRYRMTWEAAQEYEEPLLIEVKVSRGLVTGIIDEIYRDTRRGLVVCRDHKTTNTIPASSSAEDLMDSQHHLYVWAALPLLTSLGVEGGVTAVGYDRVRTTAPKTPVLTATGTLSKAITDYDLLTYQEWAAGPDGRGIPWGDPEAVYASGAKKGQPKPSGVYTEDPAVVAALSAPTAVAKWFDRTLTPVQPQAVKQHLQAAYDTRADAVNSLARFEEHGAAPRNLTRQGCKWCEFSALCRAEMMGGPGEYPLAEMGLRTRTD